MADPNLNDPAAWINLGVAGAFLGAFLTGKVYSEKTITKIETERDRAVEAAQRREDQLRAERDRALAERDEMVGVITDFNHTAAGMLQVLQGVTPPPRAPQVPRTQPRRGEQR